MRFYRRLTTLFALLLAATLFCGSGLTPVSAAQCAMMAHGAPCAAMADALAPSSACPMSAHAQRSSPMPCCRKHAGVSRASHAALMAQPCSACAHATPTLPAARQSADAPQIAPPSLDLLAPDASSNLPVSILTEIEQRRGPPRAGPFVPSPILLTPSLRAPPCVA
ncbi:MAG: hypothetical protein ABIY70_22220 [Capsulimonas sp.]|uniref:hypothetical protein n=1 Tax=Capsulimonas sp. TaxID=2494211 RepID=UPI003267AADD